MEPKPTEAKRGLDLTQAKIKALIGLKSAAITAGTIPQMDENERKIKIYKSASANTGFLLEYIVPAVEDYSRLNPDFSAHLGKAERPHLVYKNGQTLIAGIGTKEIPIQLNIEGDYLGIDGALFPHHTHLEILSGFGQMSFEEMISLFESAIRD